MRTQENRRYSFEVKLKLVLRKKLAHLVLGYSLVLRLFSMNRDELNGDTIRDMQIELDVETHADIERDD